MFFFPVDRNFAREKGGLFAADGQMNVETKALRLPSLFPQSSCDQTSWASGGL